MQLRSQLMSEAKGYARYTFRGHTGYLIHPDSADHALLAVRHSAGVAPWADADVHIHCSSEEYYLLLDGELKFLVAGVILTLKPGEMLAVMPGVPHAITGGAGLIEHFGFRAPAPDDRQSLRRVEAELPPLVEEGKRELKCEWGYRIPLEEQCNQNCWLLGVGAARFHSPNFLFAYLDFPTHEAANAGLGTRHRLHLHRETWE